MTHPHIPERNGPQTKFIRTSSSSDFAWLCVLGNPSSRKLAEGQSEAAGAPGLLMTDNGPVRQRPEAMLPRVSTQPRFDSSPTISLTMMASCTRPPDFMMLSAWTPINADCLVSFFVCPPFPGYMENPDEKYREKGKKKKGVSNYQVGFSP
jgi:hypothetical protein